MRGYDFSPFARSAIGFEHLFDMLNDRESVNNDSYPPYDIVRTGEDSFRIDLALAGFSPGDINITTEENQLTVAGKKSENNSTDYVYQGISARAFERRFNLADYIEVSGANFENGLLQISLERRVPDKMKRRRIEIGNVTQLSDRQKETDKVA